MKEIPQINTVSPLHRAGNSETAYYAMYSSIFGGIVTDPGLMLVPVDDHLVHRGDGVFETFKCVNGNIYNMEAHLARLRNSAKGLHLPPPPQDLSDIVKQTVKAGKHRDALIRVLFSRGPGSMGANPYDCPHPGLYIIVYQLKPPFMQTHPGGARVKASTIPVKPRPFVNIKSANYLFNVLMKKEAVDSDVDFVLSFDENGYLAEGPTENAGIVTHDGELRIPRPEHILAGTTMLRVIELAEQKLGKGPLQSIVQTDIPRTDMIHAAEVLIFGTTPNVTAAVEFDGRTIGDGTPGPVYTMLSKLILNDILTNSKLYTSVFS